jgi:hypothetical protein
MFAERQSRVESGFAGVAVVFVVGHGTSPIAKTSPKILRLPNGLSTAIGRHDSKQEVFAVVLKGSPLYDSLNEFRAGYRV